MSKAFTSEETGPDPLVVRPRAPLPAGSPNYVTPRGLALLQAEVATLERDRAAAEGAPDEQEPARVAALETRLTELLGRVHGATVVQAPAGPPEEVRFGATVTVQDADGRTRRYQIVGVDEASGRQGKIAFSSPLGQALLGRRPGESTTLPTPRGDEELEIAAINYDDLVES